MGIITWIIFGLLAGVIAKWIMPGQDPSGWIITIVIGVVGAMIGGFIGTQLGWGAVDSFNVQSFFLAVLGALILLTGVRFIQKRR